MSKSSLFNKLIKHKNCEYCGKPYGSGSVMEEKEYKGYIGKTPWEKMGVKQICVSCWDEKIGPFHGKYLESMLKKNKMKSYMKSYIEENKIEIKAKKIYETEYIAERWLAEEQIKMSAFIDGYDFIYDLKLDKRDIGLSNNEESLLWRATAIAAKRV